MLKKILDRQDNNRYVQLNKPKNKNYLVLLAVVVLVVVLMVTSNMWLPDSRENITTHIKDKKYPFSSSEILIESTAYSPSNLIGEVRLKEGVLNYFTRKDLTFSVQDMSGNELPLNVIKSEYVSTDADKKRGEIWYIIQFAMDPNYRGFTLTVNETDYVNRTIVFDYRDVELKELVEKGSDYLLQVTELFKDIEVTETTIETLKRNLLDIQPEVNVAQNALELASEADKKAAETKYNELSKQKTDIETALKQAEEKYDLLVEERTKWESE
ncbi:hypothetical protein G7062_10495 [Erysipelothrix sp. HDW6C]|uniref:hypothetical protein n=1 Tax=Erysipelothrix sp. HDW6C TaxID=2714930 RepID=UPI0014091B88|nr:hypothetical protein [Erysipelothrix sp. HDW6C]QIK70705.1 hypothetical protein G7062_10495 [Erysipelothrix sp. HDW6C]